MIRTDRSYFLPVVALLGAIGVIDTAILNPTISAYAVTLGAGESVAGFIAGLYSIVAIPASLAMGLAIDAIGRRLALVVGLGLTAVWIFGYALAATPLHLMLLRIAHSLSGALVFPASIAMILDAARRKIGRSIGLYWLVVGTVIAIGSAISATLVTGLGFRPLFRLVAAVSLLGMVVAIVMPEAPPRRMAPRASLQVIIASFRWLSVAYLSMFALYFAFGMIVGALSLVIIQGGVPAEEAARSTALYVALATVVSLPGFPVVGCLIGRVGNARLLGGGILLTVAAMALLLVSLDTAVLIASAVLLGGAIALVFVASTAVASIPEARGVSIGLHQTSNIAGVAVGAPVSALVLELLGPTAPFLLALLMQVIALVVIVAGRKVIRPADRELMGPSATGS